MTLILLLLSHFHLLLPLPLSPTSTPTFTLSSLLPPTSFVSSSYWLAILSYQALFHQLFHFIMAPYADDSPPKEEPKSEIPDYMTDPNAVLKDVNARWRYGRAPDYSKTRAVFAQSKSLSLFPDGCILVSAEACIGCFPSPCMGCAYVFLHHVDIACLVPARIYVLRQLLSFARALFQLLYLHQLMRSTTFISHPHNSNTLFVSLPTT